ncbi:hypothetical protein RUM44_003996 [Polyplax serrata]|uniref:Uncharacterized protein n=1 Tax=Polyplax serrata TaxID=468196 RepID=A0ABR1B1K0_POLSC
MTIPSSVVFWPHMDDPDPPSLSGGLGVGDRPPERHEYMSLLGEGESVSYEKPEKIKPIG